MIRRLLLGITIGALIASAMVMRARTLSSEEHARRLEARAREVDDRAAWILREWETRIDGARSTADLVCAHPELAATDADVETLRAAAQVDVIAQRGADGAATGGAVRPRRAITDWHADRAPRFHVLPGGASLVAVTARCADERSVLVGWDAAAFPAPGPEDGLVITGAASWLRPGETPPSVSSPVNLRRLRTLASEDGPRELVVYGLAPSTPSEPSLVTWMIALGLAALAFLVVVMLGGGAQRPDRKLEAAARRVAEGDLDVTLDGSSPTASAFNRMTRELKDARTRLTRAERIAAWRDIARRIAHEIKNPLTPIKMSMETLRKTHARKHPDFDEIFEESTKTVLEETERLERIVTEFSRFARMPRPRAESLDVLDVVEKVVSMHDLPAAHATLPEAAKGVRVELAKHDGRLPSVRADREQLTQVLVNLVQNACDAAREKQGETGGRVVVALERTQSDGVRIIVSDNGPGIPNESRSAVLEPYYTTKSHGTGLGLAIVDRIVSDHGGAVRLGDSSMLGGAEVTITLRREGPPSEPESSAFV